MNAPIDLVVFDLGGVLVRIVRSWAEAHAAAGLEPRPVLTSRRFHEKRAALALAHQVGATTPSEYFAAVAGASEGAYTADEVERVVRAWQFEEFAGVAAVVEALEAAGVATGALSNTNAVHWAELRPTTGVPRFPTVARLRHAHASHLLGLAKPDPAVYAAFERATGITGSHLLFFDDLEANVAAASAAGWRAERIDHAGDTAAQLLAHLRTHGVLRD